MTTRKPDHLILSPAKQFSPRPTRLGAEMWVVIPPPDMDLGIEDGRIVRTPKPLDPADYIARQISPGDGPSLRVRDLPRGDWLWVQYFFSMIHDIIDVLNDPPLPQPPRSPLMEMFP